MEAEESGKDPPRRGHAASSVPQLDPPLGGWESLVASPEGRQEGRVGGLLAFGAHFRAGETEAYTQQRWDLFLQPLTQKRNFRLLPR